MTTRDHGNCGPVVAIMSGKGGVGKSLIAIVFAIFAALEGRAGIQLFDFDGNPGTTDTFVNFQEKATGDNTIRASLVRDSDNRTIQRFLMRPQMDTPGVALIYSLASVLTQYLVNRRRYKVSGIDTSTLLERTLQYYQTTPNQATSVSVIPNSGSFESLVMQLREAEMRNSRIRADEVFARALSIQGEVRASHNEPAPQMTFVDTAGERGTIPDMVLRAATYVVLPIVMQEASLSGVLNTYEDVQRMRRLRGDGYPKVLPVIANKVTLDQERDETLLWLEGDARPRLENAGLSLAERRKGGQRELLFVPWSRDLDMRAARLGTIPFEYNPLDPAIMALYDIWQVFKAEMGKAA